METSFRKDTDGSCLVITDDRNPDPDSYMVKVLRGGIIPGMLKCRLQTMDGRTSICYEVTALRNLETAFEGKKLSYAEICLILESCIGMIEEMEEYLLSPDHLLLSTRCAFINPEKNRLFFCCSPGEARDVREQLQDIGEYILPVIDSGDREAMAAGYGFYRSVTDPSVPLSSLRGSLCVSEGGPGLLWEEEEEPGPEKIRREQDDSGSLWDESFLREGYPDENRMEAEGKTVLLKKAVLILPASAALILMLILLLHLGGADRTLSAGALLAVLAAFSFAGVLAARVSRRTAAEQKEPVPPRAETNHPDEQGGEYTELSAFSGYENGDDPCTELSVHPKRKEKHGKVLVPDRKNCPEILLRDGMILVGSLPGAADAVLPSKTVSRVHARITRQGDEITVRDLHSRNGTLLNGKPVSGDAESRMKDGDMITFADVRYTLKNQIVI